MKQESALQVESNQKPIVLPELGTYDAVPMHLKDDPLTRLDETIPHFPHFESIEE